MLLLIKILESGYRAHILVLLVKVVSTYMKGFHGLSFLILFTVHVTLCGVMNGRFVHKINILIIFQLGCNVAE